MRTLLATGGSTYATTALVAASQLLTRTNNQFEATCVIPYFSPPARPGKRKAGAVTDLRSKYQEETKRKTERVLKNAKRTLQAAGIETHMFTE